MARSSSGATGRSAAPRPQIDARRSATATSSATSVSSRITVTRTILGRRPPWLFVVPHENGPAVSSVQTLDRLDQGDEQRRPLGDLLDDHVLVVGVRAVADRAEAVERRNAHPGGEIAVRGAA